MINTNFRIVVITGEGQRRGTHHISTSIYYFLVLLCQKKKQKDLKEMWLNAKILLS